MRTPRVVSCAAFKGYLWNGNLRDGYRVIEELVMDLECLETD